MAGRAGIAERRLKPLWDAIDHRQYKPALKLATGLIAKHPDSAYLLALKALVLERLGKDEEAADLCEQAKASGPVDEFTLTTLQLVFQRLHKLEEATGCYEHACLKNPNNVELLTALFNCYVRQYVYIKQQQTAMKLYKLLGEERFLLWAICSIMLQVGDGNAKLLPLAEALLKKHVESHSLQELEGLLVYLKVLQQQQKHDTALAVLQGPLGNLFTITTDRLRLQGELLMHSHQYEHAVEVFQEILRLSSDDWAAFQMYIDAVLTLPIVAENLQDHPFSQFSEEEVGVKFEQVNAFILELQAMDTPDVRRGPFLAVLEVEKRRLLWKAHNAKDQQESPDSASVNLAQSILRYFERFGFMVSFASDVKEFLKHIHGAQKFWLAKALHQACLELTPAISPVKALRYRVSAFQVEYQLGVQALVTDSDVVAQAVEIMHLYLRSIQLSVDLDPQENMPGEELLTLITDLLIQLYLRTQQLGYILEAILVLEFGLAMRRYNAQYKLLLVNLYLFLSAFKPAWDRYRSVDVKYILLESMSHHMFPGLVASMDWDNLDNMLQEISKFHGDYQREAADLIILAYRHNTYSKVLEFVAFKGRLERSFQHLVVRIESIMLSLKRKANKLEEFESALSSLKGGQVAMEWVTDTQLGAVSFNEDLQTRPWWSPAPDECLLTGSSNTFSEDGDQRHEGSEEDQLRREVRWKKALKVRCLLPRLLQLAITVVTPGREADHVVLRELKQLLGDYMKSLGIFEENIGNWLSNRAASMNLKENEWHVETGDILTLAIFWTATQLPLRLPPASHSLETGFSDALAVVNKLLEAALDEVGTAWAVSTAVLAPNMALSKLVKLSSEVFAWFGLCLQVWAKRLQPVSKKKKQPEQHIDFDLMHVIEALHGAIISFCSQLEKCHSLVTAYLDRPEKGQVAALLSCVETDEAHGPGHVVSALANGIDRAVMTSPLMWDREVLVSGIVRSQRESLVGIKDCCNSILLSMKSIKF